MTMGVPLLVRCRTHRVFATLIVPRGQTRRVIVGVVRFALVNGVL